MILILHVIISKW